MGIVKKPDIRGYGLDGKIICAKCIKENDLKSLKEDELILEEHLLNAQDVFYFCDECKKQL